MRHHEHVVRYVLRVSMLDTMQQVGATRGHSLRKSGERIWNDCIWQLILRRADHIMIPGSHVTLHAQRAWPMQLVHQRFAHTAEKQQL